MAKTGIKCTVISPQSLLHVLKHGTELRKKIIIKNIGNNSIKIISPKFLVSSGKKWGVLDFNKITFYFFRKKCFNYIKKHHREFDAFYGHFISPSGIIAAQAGKKYHKPSFLAYGENGPYTLKVFGKEKTKN
ncbi:MAG: hypothetical protein GX220_00015, partial [Treponema sp.]|nr:hypothetical protein [Treponema sp.]